MAFNISFDNIISIIFSWWAIIIYVIAAFISADSIDWEGKHGIKRLTKQIDLNSDLSSQVEQYRGSKNIKPMKFKKFLTILFTVLALVGVIITISNNWENIMYFINGTGAILKIIFYIVLIILIIVVALFALQVAIVAIPAAIVIYIIYLFVEAMIR